MIYRNINASGIVDAGIYSGNGCSCSIFDFNESRTGEIQDVHINILIVVFSGYGRTNKRFWPQWINLNIIFTVLVLSWAKAGTVNSNKRMKARNDFIINFLAILLIKSLKVNNEEKSFGKMRVNTYYINKLYLKSFALKDGKQFIFPQSSY